MATTWIRPLHIKKNAGMAYSISDIIDYVENPEKTDNGRLITSYCCDSRKADEAFLQGQREYEKMTGRNQGRRSVIAYHVRQSFKPGEVDAETANRIGYELAMSFTKGNHAFVVCTHIDKAHLHNHIIFNSTSLGCDRKFKNFFFSNRAVRRISDIICAENGLSVIKNPKAPYENYDDWLGNNRSPTHQEELRRKIDEVIPACKTFDDFIAMLRADGYAVNTKRKHISVKAPGWKKPARLNTLKGDYTEEAIRRRLGISKDIAGSGGNEKADKTQIINVQPSRTKPNLLIDIQAKIQEGKGAGYEQWAKVFNLKEAAKTLIYLQENGIDSYDDLKQKSETASAEFAALNEKIKDVEKRQKEISELQKQIGTYGKTKKIYQQYKASGWSRDFYDIHSADIILHRAAKKYFDGLGYGREKRIPTINQLKQEYANLASEKKSLYGNYHALKDLHKELYTARSNAEQMLGIRKNEPDSKIDRPRNQNYHHDL